MSPSCKIWPKRWYDALAFLTRLAPPRRGCEAEDLSACVAFFAPVGLILGALYTAAALGAQYAFAGGTAAPGYPFPGAALGAWIWLIADIWATRGLHWDGLADMGDALGSGATGERFWTVLRDSRLGAFGALHLFVALSGQWLTVTGHLTAGNILTLLLAPAWGRAACIWLAAYATPHEARSLGGLACAGASPHLARWYIVLAAAMLLSALFMENTPFWRLAVLALGQGVYIRKLVSTAQKHSGLSGDFLGACIQWSQLWFLLVTV